MSLIWVPGGSSRGAALLTAGAGVVAAVAGVYFIKKVKRFLTSGKRPRMRLFHNNLLMSTRCSWLVAELGVENDIDFLTTTDQLDDAVYFLTENPALELLENLPENQRLHRHERSVRQEQDYQVVTYSPYTSCEDLHLTTPYYDTSSLQTTLQPSEPTDRLSSFQSPSSSLPPSSIIASNDEFTMIEGAAICMYLADLYGQFLPENDHKAEYYSWIVYSAATFDNIVKTLHQQMIELPESQRSKMILSSALAGFSAFARALSETLTKQKYLCGNNFTAADCVLGFTLWWAYTIDEGKLLEGYSTLTNYLTLLQSRPAFQKTFGKEEQWYWGRYFRRCIEQIK